jgi:hypothetical protein
MRYHDVDTWRCNSVTIPAERLEALRHRALSVDVSPARDAAELTRESILAHLEDTGQVVSPDLSRVDVRIHGPGIPAHDIPVREATSILTSFQDTVASIGQVLTHRATATGRINTAVLKATELRLTSELLPGSVVFQLTGPSEELSGSEAAVLTGTDTLVDAAVHALFAIVDQSAKSGMLETAGTLAQELRRFGPRVAKHLSALVDAIVRDDVDLDFTWRTPRGRRQDASLPRHSARTIQEAIKLNEVVSQRAELRGILTTISTTKKAELRTPDRPAIKIEVPDQLTPSLGPYFNQQVLVIADETVRWSINTGRETRTYRMLEIGPADTKGDTAGGPVNPGGTELRI